MGKAKKYSHEPMSKVPTYLIPIAGEIAGQTRCIAGEIALQLLDVMVLLSTASNHSTSWEYWLKQNNRLKELFSRRLNWRLVLEPFPILGLLAFIHKDFIFEYGVETPCKTGCAAQTA